MSNFTVTRPFVRPVLRGHGLSPSGFITLHGDPAPTNPHAAPLPPDLAATHHCSLSRGSASPGHLTETEPDTVRFPHSESCVHGPRVP